ncbi:MAG: glycosyltransferase [Longimonas sp.]|uniref:glycosyltransferase n=1 Tax=Longimonas sp. TaxID=2039626 RepID=UPI00397694F5
MTVSLLWWLVGGACALYGIGMAALAYGRMRSARALSDRALPNQISVVVPARNEAEALPACLDALQNQTLPDHTTLEIIVVDDQSNDATFVRAQRRLRTAVSVGDDEPSANTAALHQTHRLPDAWGAGKEAAVAYGAAQATADVVLVVDADCVPPDTWAATLARACTANTPLVCGPVRYDVDAERWLERFQALEFLGLNAYGAGTAGLGVPTICNGGNMAVHRSLMEALPDEQRTAHLAADELLLQHVAYQTNKQVRYLWQRAACVTTAPAPSWQAFWQQRKRWAHAMRSYHRTPWFFSIGIFGVHAVLLAACVIGLSDPNALSQPAVTGLLAKMGADLLLVLPASHTVEHRDLMRSYIPASLLQLIYVVGAGLHGVFGAVQWKGRTVSE